MNHPRILRCLAHGLSFIGGYISAAFWHSDTTLIVAGGGLCLLIAGALFFRAEWLADRKTDAL